MKKLLVATDLSVASNAALRFAQEQVGARGEEIEIELVTVIEDLSTALVTFEFGVAPLVSDSTYHDLQHAATQRLESLAAEYFPERKARVVAFRGSSSVAQDLAHHARETGADELIVTTHGRSGVAHFLMGSVAEEVVRQGICPTFVVPLREGSQESMRNSRGAAPILVLTDFSPESTVVFPYAREQFAACRSRGSELILMHMVEDLAATGYHLSLRGTAQDVWSDMESRADELMALFCAKYFPDEPVDAAVIRQSGSLGDEVVAFAKAKEVGLIVLASHGRKGFQHLFLGSVAERVVRRSTCPVLVVPVPAPE